jgi:RimJ/RimL family protein N-acetyltransferase
VIDVRLREVEPADLDLFFEHQQDPEALRMAAFTAADPSDRAAFDDHWDRLLSDDRITKRTIIADSKAVGHVLSFDQDGDTEVTYWVDSAHWSRGIASLALAVFLTEAVTRPLHARAAKDNVGSLTVLRRCGFTITGEDSCYANGRGEIVEEYLLTLA